MVRKKSGLIISAMLFLALGVVFSTIPAFATPCGVVVDYEPMSIPIENYVRADLGYSFLSSKPSSAYRDKPDGAMLIDLGIGYKIGKYARTDLVIHYRATYDYSGPGESQSIDSTAVVWNGYFDFNLDKYFDFKYSVTPYVGFGIGFSNNKAGNFSKGGDIFLGGSTNNFVWQVMLGSLFKVMGNLYADLMYKYVDLGNIKMKQYSYNSDVHSQVKFPSGKLGAHELSVGVIYKF